MLPPSLVPSLAGIIAIACGYYHTCAVMSGGTLYCWGYNGYGQLGSPMGTGASGAAGPESQDSPLLVSGITGVAAVACGEHNTCALTSSGGVYWWGYNGIQPLVTYSTDVIRNSPPATPILTSMAAIAAGGHMCALSTSGGVYCWGDNSDGELGLGYSGSGDSGPSSWGGCVFSPPSSTGVAQISVGDARVACHLARVASYGKSGGESLGGNPPRHPCYEM